MTISKNETKNEMIEKNSEKAADENTIHHDDSVVATLNSNKDNESNLGWMLEKSLELFGVSNYDFI